MPERRSIDGSKGSSSSSGSGSGSKRNVVLGGIAAGCLVLAGVVYFVATREAPLPPPPPAPEQSVPEEKREEFKRQLQIQEDQAEKLPPPVGS